MCALKSHRIAVRGIHNVKKGADSEVNQDPDRVLFQKGGSKQWCQTLPRCYLRGWMWVDHWICNTELVQQSHRNLVRSSDLNIICHEWCLELAHTLFQCIFLLLTSVELWSQLSRSAAHSSYRKETTLHSLLSTSSPPFNCHASFLWGSTASPLNSLTLLFIQSI